MLFLFAFGLLNTAIALFYYLKIPFFAFFRKKESAPNFNISLIQKTFIVILLLPIILYFFKADLLMNWLNLVLK